MCKSSLWGMVRQANVSSRGGSGRKSRRKIRLSSPEFAELPAPSQEGRTIIDDFWAMD